MTRFFAAVSAALVLSLGACGNDGPRLTDEASVELSDQVDAIRAAAAARDRAGAEAALGALVERLDALRGAGQVSADAAAEIRAEVDRVSAALAVIPTTTTTTTTTTTAPPPEEDDDDKDDENKGEGNGDRGKGDDD